jgi:hypothetical protein
MAAYPFIAHARSVDGRLLGYVSAFRDQAFSTMLGELVVHPDVQGKGIGRALLLAVEQAFPGIPIYVKPLGQAKEFFLACGYRSPASEMTVLFKCNAATAADELVARGHEVCLHTERSSILRGHPGRAHPAPTAWGGEGDPINPCNMHHAQERATANENVRARGARYTPVIDGPGSLHGIPEHHTNTFIFLPPVTANPWDS